MPDFAKASRSTSTALDCPDLVDSIGPALVRALTNRGFCSLTPVQEQVLDPSLRDRDLRISSQTGSGKTVAIGLVLRDVVAAPRAEVGSPRLERGSPAKAAEPRAIVIVPTRELAAQVELELSWLYAQLGLRVASVTGGASYRDEHRALARGPAVVVGTPGRLLDHLKRRAIDASGVGAVVLDEADQMLDLGFREELEAILGHMPESRRTHLVSATFARDVIALADRVQTEAARVEGTPLGSANADIDHVVHVIEPSQRVDALINVLLYHPDDQTLIFARTRADVADIARELSTAGFAAGALSGEMDQLARNRALAAFKRGQLRALVATDVAARGIDVQNIARVVQIDAPSNADSYTHRSGRTGRAGRKGTSVLLVSKAALRRTEQMLQRARVKGRIEPVPTAETIRAAQDERMLDELTASTEVETPERLKRQVARILAGGHTELALARLLNQLQRAQGEPRQVSSVKIAPPRERHARGRGRGRDAERFSERRPSGKNLRSEGRRDRADSPRWALFRVTCGKTHGVDARRLVAMLCRRGRIRGADIGAIRVSANFSEVEVSREVARSFAEATLRTDPRNPRVNVQWLTASVGATPPRRSVPKPFKKRKQRVLPEHDRGAALGRPAARER